MKMPIVSSRMLRNIGLYGIAYLLWFINTLVCVASLIQFLSTVNVFWVALGGDRYTLSLVNQVCLLLGALVVFVYVIYLGSYYGESVADGVHKTASSDDFLVPPRASVSQQLTKMGLGLLLRRFAITTAIPLAVWIAALMALEIALRIL